MTEQMPLSGEQARFEVVLHIEGSANDGRSVHIDKRFEAFAPNATLADVSSALHVLIRDLVPVVTTASAWVEIGIDLP